MNPDSLLQRLDAPGAGYVPWAVEEAPDVPLGWIRRDRVPELLAASGPDRWGRAFEEALVLRGADPAARTRAVDAIVGRLAAEGQLREYGERYPVVAEHGAPEALHIDRGAAQWFGIRAFGVHLNGFVRHRDGIRYWVGRRAQDKPTFGGMLDNTVAGGMPRGLGVRETLVKEALEEASIPADLVAAAVEVPSVSYIVESERGLRVDRLFCFDLELPADFEPRPCDGEVESFQLLPLADIARLVATRQAFKFNCNWVLDSFLTRHPPK